MERMRDTGSAFWDTYHSLLLVRNPFSRFRSHVSMSKHLRKQTLSDLLSNRADTNTRKFATTTCQF